MRCRIEHGLHKIIWQLWHYMLTITENVLKDVLNNQWGTQCPECPTHDWRGIHCAQMTKHAASNGTHPACKEWNPPSMQALGPTQHASNGTHPACKHWNPPWLWNPGQISSEVQKHIFSKNLPNKVYNWKTFLQLVSLLDFLASAPEGILLHFSLLRKVNWFDRYFVILSNFFSFVSHIIRRQSIKPEIHRTHYWFNRCVRADTFPGLSLSGQFPS